MGRTTEWTIDVRERLYHIKNRATKNMSDCTNYYVGKVQRDGHNEITKFIEILTDTILSSISDPPLYRELKRPVSPQVTVESNGSIHYTEGLRSDAKDMGGYVEEMERGPMNGELAVTNSAEQERLKDEIMKIFNSALKQEQTTSSPDLEKLVLQTLQSSQSLKKDTKTPFLFLRSSTNEDPGHRGYDPALTKTYLSCLRSIAENGLSFKGKVVLITGCGKGSIGVELLKGMIRGGATVYATTSRFSAESSEFYRSVYDNHGAKSSKLIVLPFNQSSAQDVKALVNFLYDQEKADLDFVIPFAAISEIGLDIGSIEWKSEVAHRLMLTNLVRLLGEIKNKKQSLAIDTRPAHVRCRSLQTTEPSDPTDSTPRANSDWRLSSTSGEARSGPTTSPSPEPLSDGPEEPD
eukprot:TRINITY_DN2852_c0_g3_i1.p1 TRINITY_DN2852_c0_g3~~TRINITY_DN2852_c0_g3_i1.p1  ORF type:complete len:407 (-),score=158.44 TRINITY_DN2852_c0_g3_i1:667-1887(-)